MLKFSHLLYGQLINIALLSKHSKQAFILKEPEIYTAVRRYRHLIAQNECNDSVDWKTVASNINDLQ